MVKYTLKIEYRINQKCEFDFKISDVTVWELLHFSLTLVQ